MKKFLWELYRKLNKLPKLVRLEASSLCQLNCRDCYMRKDDKTCIVGSGYLKFNDFKNFINKNPYITDIELSFSGEIFLNPDLINIIKYAYEKDIVLTALNGVNFNSVSDEVLEAMVKYKFKGICFSIDAVTDETYQIYRRNGNLNNVISNIQKLNEYKKKYNSIYPILEWQYILFKHNINEIKGIKNLAENLKIENIYFKEPWNKEVKFNDLGFEEQTIIQYFKNNHKIYKILNQSIPGCFHPFIQPQINWDGRLLGCYCSTHNELNINVFETGLKNALKSEKMKFMRDVIQGKRTSDNTISCHWCDTYKQMKEQNKFIDKKQIKFI